MLPDCWDAVLVFESVATQWRRAGMTGVPCGLDYSVLPFALQMRGIPRKQWPQVFDDVRVIEDGALAYFDKKLKK